jgi:hypothetical protein
MRRVYLLILMGLCSACATPPDQVTNKATEPVVETAVALTNEVTAQLAPPPKPKPFNPLENVNLKDIDQTLVSSSANFNIQFVTQSSPDCKLVMQYPQVSGLADPGWQKELNGILKQEMMRKMRAPKEMLPGDRCKDRRPPFPKLYTVTGHCDVRFATDRLISLNCNNYMMPAAVPINQNYSMTFDLATGKVFQITELFKSNVNVPVRLALLLRDAWWETTGRVAQLSLPIESIETGEDIDFYFEDQCGRNHSTSTSWNKQFSRFGSLPEVCMITPNIRGSGASRNIQLYVDLRSVKDILETRSALSALQRKIR